MQKIKIYVELSWLVKFWQTTSKDKLKVKMDLQKLQRMQNASRAGEFLFYTRNQPTKLLEKVVRTHHVVSKFVSQDQRQTTKRFKLH